MSIGDPDLRKVTNISITARPRMTLSDAIFQAANVYLDQYPDATRNPFNFKLRLAPNNEDCVELSQFNGVDAAKSTSWHVDITDSTGRVSKS